MPDVSIALSAKDKVSSILKKVGQISGETADEIDKLQDSLDTLSSAKVDLKTNLDKVRQQVSEARKEFRKLGDSVSEQNYKDKLSELEKLEQQYYAVSKSIRMVENEETSLAGTRSKLSNREAGGSSGSMLGTVGSALATAGFGDMLSNSLSGAAGAFFGSYYGTTDGAAIESFLGSAISGATMGATVGSMIGGPGLGTAIGAAAGGLFGKQLFSLVAGLFADANTAGGVQAGLLLLATFATLLYTINRSRLHMLQVRNKPACVLIGLGLGMLGTFLGIGGGPFNMAVLYFFFSMTTKVAAQNSLYVILISQSVGILATALGDGIPSLSVWLLAGMVLCGVIGGEVGGRINKRLSEQRATWLFEAAMVLVMAISCYNIYAFFF